MNEEEKIMKLAYAAGAIDGDGSLSLIKKYENKDGSPLYYPLIQLANADKTLIDFLYGEFGGHIHKRSAYQSKDGCFRKENWQWKLEKAPTCQPFLKEISEFLKVKKERANLLSSYISENPFKRGSNRLAHNILQNREDKYLKMKRLNELPFQGKIFSGKRKNADFQIFWSYLAGLLDTDGSFSIGRHSHVSRINPSYSPYISLSMIDVHGLNYILENCEFGFVKLYKASSTKSGFCYRWALHAKGEVIFTLQKVLPFLKLKKRNAEVLLDFCMNKKNVGKCRFGVPQEELDFRENCYLALKKFNNGVYKPSLIGLEARQGDKGEGESHAERLNEMALKEDAKV